MASAPRNWPQVLVGARRFCKWGSSSAWCYVRMVNPVNGEMAELAFPTVGTTLPGARLARGLD